GPEVGEIAPHHLGAAVGGGVVDGGDLEGAALPARHLQRAAQHLAPLIVEDRDRDGAQFGTWRLIIGPTTLAIGTGTRFHASMKWPQRLASRSTQGQAPRATTTKLHGSEWGREHRPRAQPS